MPEREAGDPALKVAGESVPVADQGRAELLPSEKLRREADFYWTWQAVAEVEVNQWEQVRKFLARMEDKGWVMTRG